MTSKPTLVTQCNPQDPSLYRDVRRRIFILAPSIDEALAVSQESEDEFPHIPEAPAVPEVDEVEELFLSVQTECSRSRIVIRPMLDEIEEELAKANPLVSGLERVVVKHEERIEEISTGVIIYRFMGPVKMPKPKPKRSRKRISKQRKWVSQHPEKVQELFNLCIQLKKTEEELREWKARSSNPHNPKLIDKKMRILGKTAFPESIQANVRSFLRDESVSVKGYLEAELQELKNRLFPGLARLSVKELLCRYRGPVEFPYRSEFDSSQFQEEMRRRKD